MLCTLKFTLIVVSELFNVTRGYIAWDCIGAAINRRHNQIADENISVRDCRLDATWIRIPNLNVQLCRNLLVSQGD